MTQAQLATVPAYPLGKPADRDRYSMTPEQAAIYRILVERHGNDVEFAIGFRTIAKWCSKAHDRVTGLVERGWLEATSNGCYAFVDPVMHFPKVATIDVEQRRYAARVWGKKARRA